MKMIQLTKRLETRTKTLNDAKETIKDLRRKIIDTLYTSNQPTPHRATNNSNSKPWASNIIESTKPQKKLGSNSSTMELDKWINEVKSYCEVASINDTLGGIDGCYFTV